MKAARRATAALTLGTLAFMGCAGDTDVIIDYAPCKTHDVQTVNADGARISGYAVDHDLALFGHAFSVAFHRGNNDCLASPPSTTGQFSVRADLIAIKVHDQVPTFDTFDVVCPDYVGYEAALTIGADDGSLLGTFNTELISDRNGGLLGGVTADVSHFGGSLTFPVDESRPHEAHLGGTLTLSETEPSGYLFLSVRYQDGGHKSPVSEQGDGLFWPADGEPHCNWLDVREPSKSPSKTLDAYNRP